MLYLDSNTLTGEIPSELGHLTSLVDLRLRRNNLRGPLPTELGQLDQLEILYLDSNGLTGAMPTTLGLLTQLTELICTRINWKGRSPTNWAGQSVADKGFALRSIAKECLSLFYPHFAPTLPDPDLRSLVISPLLVWTT